MICDQGVHIFTDHRNLLFTFHSLSVEPSIARHKTVKVDQWTLFLSKFHYVIEHIDGESNDFTNMLTRWMKGYRISKSCICCVRKVLTYSRIPTSPYKPGFIGPTRKLSLNAQSRVEILENCTKYEGGVVWKAGKIWFPDDKNDLKLRLLTFAHAGESGHRRSDSTIDALKSEFTLNRLADDVGQCVSDCLLGITAKSGNRIQSPLSSSTHATKPRKILHFDYLYLGRSSGIEKCVLILKADFSSFCCLEPVDGWHLKM